jgi:hypothetical protein
MGISSKRRLNLDRSGPADYIRTFAYSLCGRKNASVVFVAGFEVLFSGSHCDGSPHHKLNGYEKAGRLPGPSSIMGLMLFL